MSTIALPKEHIITNIGFKHILVATDFSATSRRALAHGLAIAQRYGGEISVVHAVPPDPREPIPMDPLPVELNRQHLQAKREMNRLEMESNFREVRHKTAIAIGNVAEVLSLIISRDHPDLLVLGTHGRGGLKQLVLGSVAEEVLRVVSCPVLTVGPQVEEPTSQAAIFNNILFATDFGAASAYAFPFALFLAEQSDAKLVLLHMIPPMALAQIGAGAYGQGDFAIADLTAWREQVRQESLGRLKKLIPAGAKLVSQPEYVVETSFLPEGILDVAQMYKSDLIVMGANRTSIPRLAHICRWLLFMTFFVARNAPF